MYYFTILIFLLLASCVLEAIEIPITPNNNADIYFNSLLNGDYETCTQMSSDQVKTALSAAKLQETWEGLSEQLGGFLGLLEINEKENPPNHTHIYVLNFDKMVIDMIVTLADQGVVVGLFFNPSSVPKPGVDVKLPDYLDAKNIITREVAFDCDGLQVHGILTVPAKAVSYPIVLMLSGSGPNDMDETVRRRKPFRDLANGLANHGIATLRWSKRTLDYPSKFKGNESFTMKDEYLPETVSALKFLKADKSIKGNGYFLLGHSMGAYVLPIAAKEVKGVSGFIMLAGNARPLEDLVVEQYKYIFGLDMMTPEKKKELDKLTAQAAAIKLLSKDKPAPDTLLLGVPKGYWLSLNNYHQVEVFQQSKAPFLILQGEKDYQVSMTNYNLWKKASGNNVILKSYPNLDHLFMKSEGKSTPDSYFTLEYVDPTVIEDIAGWIKQRQE